MDTAILFDLDGTLLNTLEDLADSTNAALSQLGYPARTLEEVRRFVGNGALRLMEQAVPEGGDALSAYRAFRTYYDAHSQIKTAPYPGILKALAEIQQKHPVAIVSNKPDSDVKILCSPYFPGLPPKACPGHGFHGYAGFGLRQVHLCGRQRGGCTHRPKRRSPLPQRAVGVPGQRTDRSRRRKGVLRRPRGASRQN